MKHGTTNWKVQHNLAGVKDACFDGNQLWLASANGTATITTGSKHVMALPDDREATAVACRTGAQHAFSGGPGTVQTFDAASGELKRWEWVTNLTSNAGGVYDGPVSSMVLASTGELHVAPPVAINTRHTNGTVSRFDFQQGLPMNETQLVAVEADTNALWAASPAAVMRLSPPLSASPGEVMPGQWRYFHGGRYLLGSSKVAFIDTTHANQTLVVTDGGIVVLEWQWWTLAAKAEHYESILTRHIRHGMVSDCTLKHYGNASSCVNGPSDNNGLWTSLLVVAEAYKYALSPSKQQLERVEQVFAGMKLLVDVTGVKGLMARSAVSPDEPVPSGGTWHNSTNPDYEGWLWKGDASSDEVVGHMFAYPVIMAAMPNSTIATQARQLFEDIVTYIVKNDFVLIDVTGNHTRWGVWAPQYLNKLSVLCALYA